jgi:hypothetical protein
MIGATSRAGRGVTRGSATSQRERLQPSSPDNWLGGTGNWSNGSDWTSGLPGSASDVTINTSSDYVTLDTSSSINSLTVGGSGTLQTSTLVGDGNAHSLDIAGSLTVGPSGYFQLQNDVVTASSLTESGHLDLSGGSTLTINGNATVNSAALLSTSYGYLGSGGNNTLNITGTLTNGLGGAVYIMGQGDVANIGQLINHSDVQIGSGATLNLTNQPGLTDIASDEDYSVAGTFNAEGHSALANLTTVEGALVLSNGQDTQITPSGGTFTLTGTDGGFGGAFLLYRNSTVHINGNFDNASGGMAVGDYQQVDASNLYVSGTLTLGSGTSLQIWGQGAMVSAGSLNVMSGGVLVPFTDGTLRVNGDVTNSGCIGYCEGGPAGGNTYDIGGTFNNTGGFATLAGDQMIAAAVVNSGYMSFAAGARLNVGSLTLNPGSGLNIGISGLNSFGMILATGSVALNGELHVTLYGYNPPVAQEFKFLTFTPGALSGTFSGVSSNGENFAVDYENSGGYVALVAEGNSSVPEPGSFVLVGSGVLSLAAMARRKMKV